MGVAEEHHGLLSGRPELKRNGSTLPPPSTTTTTPRWARARSLVTAPCSWSKKTVISILAALSIIALLSSGSCSSHRKNWKFVDRDPVRQADSADMQELKWEPKAGCRNTPHAFPRFTTAVGFGGDHRLSIQETVQKGRFPSWRLPEVYGHVVLRPTTTADNNKNDTRGSIDLEVISNDEKLDVQVDADFDGDNQRLRMTIPRAEPSWPLDEGPCIQIRAVVWVPREAYLRKFDVETVQLGVDLRDGLVMGVSDDVRFSTATGAVRTSLLSQNGAEGGGDDAGAVPYTLQSRRITIETVSASITGWFPLYDGLKLSSSSGDVMVQVGPKPASDNGDRKARLDVSTISGTVNVTEPLWEKKKLPARAYTARLSTASGDLAARVASTCEADFRSISGKLNIEVLPVLDARDHSSGSVRTETKSSDVHLTVLEPIWVHIDENDMDVDYESTALDRLKSNHHSMSGALHLRYPSSWAGQFHAETLSGDVDVRGKGVEIIRRGRSIARYIDGRKGDGSSDLVAKTISGDVDLTFA